MTSLDTLTRPTVNRYLASLCKELGAPPAPLDEDLKVVLIGRLDGEEISVLVALDPESATLTMTSPVGRIEEGGALAEQLTAFLALNLVTSETLGTSFALEPKTAEVLLTLSIIGPDTEYRFFRSSFFRVFSVAAAWRTERGVLFARSAAD